MKRNDAHDAGIKNWKSAREAVRCPGCGLDAADAGRGTRPRWKCADVRCPFQVGWRLEFADMTNPDTTAMVAVPLGDDFSGAVPWPRP
jgi:hypothetical protein